MRRLYHDALGPGRLTFSPDGRWLYGVFENELIGWNLSEAAPEPVKKGICAYSVGTRRLVCSPCGRWVIHVAQSEATAFDLEGPVLDPMDPARKHLPMARDAVFAPSGQTLLTVEGPAQRDAKTSYIRHWHFGVGGPLDGVSEFTLKPTRGVKRGVSGVVAVSPDGERVAAMTFGLKRNTTNYERYLTVWDRACGEVVADVPTAPSHSERLAYTADGSSILSNLGLTLIRYDAENLRPTAEYHPVDGAVNEIAVGPAGRWVVVGAGERVALLDPLTLMIVAEYDFGLGPQTRVAVAPDGLTVAACGTTGEVVLFDLD